MSEVDFELPRSFLGLVGEDGDIARRVFAFAVGEGATPDEAVELIRWGQAKAHGNTNRQALWQNLVATVPSHVARIAAKFTDTVEAQGFDAVPLPSGPSAEEVAEIRALIEEDPTAADDELVAQVLLDGEAMEAEQQQESEQRFEANHSKSITSPLADRKAEIEEIMRTDEGRYWSPHDSSLRDEYTSIVEDEMVAFEPQATEPAQTEGE